MDIALLYKISLTFHFIGFITLAGASFADYVAARQFWKIALNDWEKAAYLKQVTVNFPKLMGLGGALVLTSGFAMVGITASQDAFTLQLWFAIKMVLVLLIVLNTTLLGRRQSVKILAMVNELKSTEKLTAILDAKGKHTVYQVSQLVMFIMIVVLSVFRFM